MLMASSPLKRIGSGKSAAAQGKLLHSCTKCAARLDGLCGETTSEVADTIADYKSGDYGFVAGEDLFSQGESCASIYTLIDGWVMLYVLTEDGRRQILDFCMPGAMLSMYPMDRGEATYGAQALTDVTACVIPRERFDVLIGDHPEIALRLAWQTAREREIAYNRMASIGRLSARERVARLLLELFVRHRVHWLGHDIGNMDLPLTQEHIGDATGMTNVHVNRVLKSLRDDGILNCCRGHLHVIDPDKLMDAAEADINLIRLWMQRAPNRPSAPEISMPREYRGFDPIRRSRGDMDPIMFPSPASQLGAFLGLAGN